MYAVFWNGKAISRGKVFRFFIEDLPNDLTRAMDGASPLPDEEARTEIPEVVEVPKPKTEAPKPKSEAPKPEAPKPEATKPEAPKPEAPKPEAPKPEAPKPEAPKPIIEQAGEAVIAADKTVTATVDAAVDAVKKVLTGSESSNESSEESPVSKS